MEIKREIVKWLKRKGCVAIDIDGGMVVFFLEGFYGFIEVKKSKNAKLRPGQKEFIEKMDNWSYGKIIYPENWDEAKKELDALL